eukprot:GHVP01055392.1.p1 GENE.GHVP01055392.1~~GHVP01055392.1.p1  ORF type:complete len:301 (+),score=21.29 GHVP01055392.1:1100-2002(+)
MKYKNRLSASDTLNNVLDLILNGFNKLIVFSSTIFLSLPAGVIINSIYILCYSTLQISHIWLTSASIITNLEDTKSWRWIDSSRQEPLQQRTENVEAMSAKKRWIFFCVFGAFVGICSVPMIFVYPGGLTQSAVAQTILLFSGFVTTSCWLLMYICLRVILIQTMKTDPFFSLRYKFDLIWSTLFVSGIITWYRVPNNLGLIVMGGCCILGLSSGLILAACNKTSKRALYGIYLEDWNSFKSLYNSTTADNHFRLGNFSGLVFKYVLPYLLFASLTANVIIAEIQQRLLPRKTFFVTRFQ